MKYKQELLSCYEREEAIKKIKAIISFIEDKEKDCNKELGEFTKEEIKEVLDRIKDYYITLDGVRIKKEEIYYHISYYLELVNTIENNK